jgi:hypothetical protein
VIASGSAWIPSPATLARKSTRPNSASIQAKSRPAASTSDVSVEHHHRRPVGGQGDRRRLSHAAGGAGDDGDFS